MIHEEIYFTPKTRISGASIQTEIWGNSCENEQIIRMYNNDGGPWCQAGGGWWSMSTRWAFGLTVVV